MFTSVYIEPSTGSRGAPSTSLAGASHWTWLAVLPSIPTSIEKGSGYTLWLFNIAMENGPFIDGLPIEPGDFQWLC